MSSIKIFLKLFNLINMFCLSQIFSLFNKYELIQVELVSHITHFIVQLYLLTRFAEWYLLAAIKVSTQVSFLRNSSINIYLNNCLLGNKESPKCRLGNHIKTRRIIIFNLLLEVESMLVKLFLKAIKKICWIVSLVVIRSVKSVARPHITTSCSYLKVQLCFHTAPRHFYTCTPV